MYKLFASLLFSLVFSLLLQPAAADDKPQEGQTQNGPYCFVTKERYDLYYPVARRVYLEGIGLQRIITESLDGVEARHGKIGKKVFFVVYDRDTFGKPEQDLFPALTRQIDEGVQVLLTPWSINHPMVRHELMHAWLIAQGFSPNPPVWLHEGLAYYEQHEDGFDETLFTLLLGEGPLSYEVLNTPLEGEPRGLINRRNATGWLLVYYCTTFKKQTPAEIIVAWRENRLPNPAKAFEAVVKLREKVRAEQQRAKDSLAQEIERIAATLEE